MFIYIKDGSEQTQGSTSGIFDANSSTEDLNGKGMFGYRKPNSAIGSKSSMVEASNVYSLGVDSLKINSNVSVWPLVGS